MILVPGRKALQGGAHVRLHRRFVQYETIPRRRGIASRPAAAHEVSMDTLVMLAAAGFIAGAMNALTGGGSFVSLPAMIAAGLPSVAANASSTVALYPGGAASTWVYRDGLRQVEGLPLIPSLIATLVGGLAGALLLLWTPSSVFDRIVPWLLLVATITLTLGSRLGAWLRARLSAGPRVVLAIQFLLGVYGGYFGGAVGLMMLAAWSLITTADIKLLNPTRMLLVTAANTIAVLCFIVLGGVWWTPTLVLGAGAIAGGYGGAHLGKRLPARAIRAITLIVAFGITAAFFYRAYVR